MVLGWSFSVSSNIKASAAEVVCLKAPWLCELLCPLQGCSVSHAGHTSVRVLGTPLACVPSWLSPHVGSTVELLGSSETGSWCLLSQCPAVQARYIGEEFILCDAIPPVILNPFVQLG